ncbi:MAG: rod-binding protein [Lachnospiraceae bacterium]|nr:rod-binding protein [Lachnospiraceae bacterium]
MSISLNSDINSVMSNLNASKASSTKAASIESTLSNLGKLEEATDEELMQACKSFEAYLIERVMTKTKEAIIPSDENENKYLTMFKGKLYEEYANQIAENGELGIAQQLYEAMRRDYGTPSVKKD